MALLVPESIDEAFHSVSVVIGFVVLAKAAFNEVVKDEVA